MPWKTLLVPHDFSPCAVRAERLAVELALVHGADLVLLHVASTPADAAPDSVPSEPAGAAAEPHDPKAKLEHIAATLRAQGLGVLAETRAGALVDTILDEVQRSSVDAIVMGTHGRRGLQRLLLGSVAEEVLRRADVPVITLRYEDEESVTPLLVPVTAT